MIEKLKKKDILNAAKVYNKGLLVQVPKWRSTLDKTVKKLNGLETFVYKDNGVRKVWIGGSTIRRELGKYIRKWNERIYSDIDLYILTKKNLSHKKIGLVRKLYKSSRERYFRLSVDNGSGDALKFLDRFQVDVWLMSPSSYRKDLKNFPDLLDSVREVR